MDSKIITYRLYNANDSIVCYEKGYIPTKVNLQLDYFFGQKIIDKIEQLAHPAPRIQYVVTLKGKLRFTVTNGDSFIIEPGVILLAEDIEGVGHTWELIEGDVWERLYLVPKEETVVFMKEKE